MSKDVGKGRPAAPHVRAFELRERPKTYEVICSSCYHVLMSPSHDPFWTMDQISTLPGGYENTPPTKGKECPGCGVENVVRWIPAPGDGDVNWSRIV
jgi:hypothetical protein